MSMLDAFFSRGAFKAARCKTLLKLTIPRIKLLRNRREIQLKQMRKDIANLLETGQEATARIRVEHIIREENMMATQEILELFCELIAVRLPVIEIQRECPIDLKEAISTICFAAPRCADLPELQQVQMQFAAKYGKEFATAATELLPDSGVNRQIIELLSVRAPPVEVKMKLLKDIAEEHELDWDPAATEAELNKPHEDLLNGPSHFISGYSVPLPKEKHEELPYSTSKAAAHDKPESELENEQDPDFDLLDLPEVPKVSVLQSPPTVPNPDSVIPGADPTLPTTAPTLPTRGPTFLTMSPIVPASLPTYLESKKESPSPNRHDESDLGPDIVNPTSSFSSPKEQLPTSAVDPKEMNEPASVFSPAQPHTGSSFIIPEVPQPQPPQPFSSFSQTKSDVKIDLDDVVAAAHNAAESAERAAAAARAAASLAQIRIAELTAKRNGHNEWLAENGSVVERSYSDKQNVVEKPVYDQHLLNEYSGSGLERSDSERQNVVEKPEYNQHLFNEYSAKDSSIEKSKQDTETPVASQYQPSPQTSRSTSLEDDPYFSYPNLFGRQTSNVGK